MRNFVLLISMLLILLCGWLLSSKPGTKAGGGDTIFEGFLPEIISTNKQKDRLGLYAKELSLYAKSNNCNATLCYLVDMSLPGGKNRFFVYDLTGDSIKYSSLVARGGGSTGSVDVTFSNTVSSGYTSTGKYKIGIKYKGRFGIAFKLHGLDSSNSNAYKRFIVLHSYSCVPDYEVYPAAICNSLGCPMVSVRFMKLLEKEILQSKKPVLLWIIK